MSDEKPFTKQENETCEQFNYRLGFLKGKEEGRREAVKEIRDRFGSILLDKNEIVSTIEITKILDDMEAGNCPLMKGDK